MPLTSGTAELLVTLPHPTHRPVTHPGYLGGCQPTDLLGHRFQNYVL
jgi:hypothetical protein